jgi:hypothetical protein
MILCNIGTDGNALTAIIFTFQENFDLRFEATVVGNFRNALYKNDCSVETLANDFVGVWVDFVHIAC